MMDPRIGGGMEEIVPPPPTAAAAAAAAAVARHCKRPAPPVVVHLKPIDKLADR